MINPCKNAYKRRIYSLNHFLLANGKVITQVSVASAVDVDIAVKAARESFKTTWGLNCPASVRSSLMNKLANLMEEHIDELTALDALDNGTPGDCVINVTLIPRKGKPFYVSRATDIQMSIETFKFFASLAGKNSGKTIEVC